MIDTEQMAYFKIMLELFTLYPLLLLESVKGASLFVDLLYRYSLNLHFKNKKVSEDKRCIYLNLAFVGNSLSLVRPFNVYADRLVYIMYLYLIAGKFFFLDRITVRIRSQKANVYSFYNTYQQVFAGNPHIG